MGASATPMIEVRHLHKRYGASVAIDDVSFDVSAGEVFALLGPNGDGQDDDGGDS